MKPDLEHAKRRVETITEYISMVDKMECKTPYDFKRKSELLESSFGIYHYWVDFISSYDTFTVVVPQEKQSLESASIFQRNTMRTRIETILINELNNFDIQVKLI